MVALSTGYSFYSKKTAPNTRQIPERRISSRSLVVLPCHSREPIHDNATNKLRRTKEELKRKEENERKQESFRPNFLGFEELGKSLKESLSPKQKGDWKDLTLMSLSFAVYVYISQRIVCAYFVWMSMPRQQW